MPDTRASSTRPRDLFLDALEKPAEERAAFLDAACAGDAALRAEVEGLLREHETAGDFLATPAFNDTASTLAITSDMLASMEKAGDCIGRYKLLQKIGEGGCGVVYMAEQEEPVRRRVALKIIKLGMDTKAVIARFEAERQALAMMEHPNIARVLDAGATETGRPYFVMELVRGTRVTEYCDENNLSTEERLELFIQVCHAIQHAHQKGVIHRDIKPSNILVTMHDAVPVPKVIDFGIAKATEQRLTDKTLFTEFQSFIGTPAYMSPEQAEMSGLDIDTRSDIYALGVLLYEMLTGTTPFDPRELMRLGLDGTRKTIREKEPARPSTRLSTMVEAELTATAERRRIDPPKLIHTMRGDLDWIVMKCLEKDRTRRYATANDLAADVQRFLDGDMVLARPPSNVYLLQKFLRRHRRVVAAAAAIAITLVGGITVSTWQAVRARLAERNSEAAQRLEAGLRRRAEHDRAVARLNEYVADINLVQQSLAAENYGRAVQLLNKHRPRRGEPDVRGFEWRYLWQLTRGDEHTAFPNLGEAVAAVALSPDGEWLAAGSDHKLEVWNARTRAPVFSRSDGASSLAFSPDGALLFVAGPFDGRRDGPARMEMRGIVRVFRTKSWNEVQTLPGQGGPLSFSQDGRRLATSSRDGMRAGVRVWDTEMWMPLHTVRDASAPFGLSPDGRRLAAEHRSTGGLAVWTPGDDPTPVALNDSTNLFVRLYRDKRDRALAFSPDGRLVVAARNLPSEHGVFVMSVWNAATGEEVGQMPGEGDRPEHTGGITTIVFSPDGRTLATAGKDHSIRLWDFENRQHLRALQGNLNEVWTIAFSRDGRHIASGSRDGAVNLWPLQAPQQREDFAGARLPIGFSTNGTVLAALNRENSVLFVNLETGVIEKEIDVEAPRIFGGGIMAVAVSADLRTLAVAAEGGVKLWNTETEEATTLRSGERGALPLGLSPDARTLVTANVWGERTIRWWDLRHGTNVVAKSDAERLLFAPDSRTAALFNHDNGVEIWDVTTFTPVNDFTVEAGFAPPVSGSRASFSPDGKLLAIACQDDAVRLWDVATLDLVATFIGHKQSIVAVAFAPEGRTLATASEDSTLKFWNIATQQELFTIRRLGGGLRALTFSPDGRVLVAGTSSTVVAGGLRVFRAPLLKEIDAAETEAQARSAVDL